MKNEEKTYRAIDANLNRAVEGLRVAEDGIRFLHDNAAITSRLRKIRRDLRANAALLPGGEKALLAARDSIGDVARNAAPGKRSGAQDIIPVNFKRAQEAVRSLEEFSKIISPAAAVRFGEIRFKLYDIEKEIALSLTGNKSLPPAPFIYLVADFATLSSGGSFRFLKETLAGGCGIIQLREKNATDLELIRMAKAVAAKIKNSRALFFVNDRVDIALAAGADGVHLGADDMQIAEARKIARGKLLFGISTHSMKQALSAAALSPDYLALGPIFQSPTKTELKPIGVALLRRVCAAVELPVVAIGGIDETGAAAVASTGAAGAAIISSICNAKNPRTTTLTLLSAMQDNFNKPNGG